MKLSFVFLAGTTIGAPNERLITNEANCCGRLKVSTIKLYSINRYKKSSKNPNDLKLCNDLKNYCLNHLYL